MFITKSFHLDEFLWLKGSANRPMTLAPQYYGANCILGMQPGGFTPIPSPNSLFLFFIFLFSFSLNSLSIGVPLAAFHNIDKIYFW